MNHPPSTIANSFSQLVLYALAGSAAVMTHLAVLSLLVELTQVNKTLASAIGFACAIPVNYLLQHRFVFHTSGTHSVHFVRYIIVTLSTAIINALLFWILAEVLVVHYMTSQIITIGLIFTINFVLNRSYTFASLDRKGSLNDTE